MQKVTFSFYREDCNTIADSTADVTLTKCLAGSGSPILAMWDWLRANAQGYAYDSEGVLKIQVPAELGVAYLAGLVLMHRIAPEYDFRGMAFRLNPVLAGMAEYEAQSMTDEMQGKSEPKDESFRWN